MSGAHVTAAIIAALLPSIGFVAGAWWATRGFVANADHFDRYPEDYGA